MARISITPPIDAAARRSVEPVICYPNKTLPRVPLALYQSARQSAEKIDECLVPARSAACFVVPEGHFFRITSIEGPQVGDLNLWNSDNLNERFYSGKTRALHGSHITVGERMWSGFPALRPMATITDDSLSWYGIDEYGGSVHDVIGTRCDPYTYKLTSNNDYHYCCHSNLTRALVKEKNIKVDEAEKIVHDVLNVFMLTGFTNDTKQYFMKSSPVRPGDYLEFFAETDLLGALSACPGGDCGSEHSSDVAKCYPLKVSIWDVDKKFLEGIKNSKISSYNRDHGLTD